MSEGRVLQIASGAAADMLLHLSNGHLIMEFADSTSLPAATEFIRYFGGRFGYKCNVDSLSGGSQRITVVDCIKSLRRENAGVFPVPESFTVLASVFVHCQLKINVPMNVIRFSTIRKEQFAYLAEQLTPFADSINERLKQDRYVVTSGAFSVGGGYVELRNFFYRTRICHSAPKKHGS